MATTERARPAPGKPGRYWLTQENTDFRIVESTERPAEKIGESGRLLTHHGPYDTKEAARARFDRIQSNYKHQALSFEGGR